MAEEKEPGVIEIEGKTYRMSKLDGPEISELDRWVQDQIVQLAIRNSAGESNQTRRLLMEAALKIAAGASWLEDTGRPVIQSMNGVSRLIWTTLRKNHKELKVDDVEKLMRVDGAVESAMTEFRRQNPNLFL